MLYKTFQSLVERRTESVTSMNHGLSVAVSSIYIHAFVIVIYVHYFRLLSKHSICNANFISLSCQSRNT